MPGGPSAALTSTAASGVRVNLRAARTAGAPSVERDQRAPGLDRSSPRPSLPALSEQPQSSPFERRCAGLWLSLIEEARAQAYWPGLDVQLVRDLPFGEMNIPTGTTRNP